MPRKFNSKLFELALELAQKKEDFLFLLETVTYKKKFRGEEGLFISKRDISIDAQIVIFGDLNGELHSLISDLEEMMRLKFLNEELKIQHPDCYIVFNGNLINRGYFFYETLALLLLLIDRNPDRIFYIHGEEEKKTYFELKEDATSPLDKTICEFLNTLPSALYFKRDENLIKFICGEKLEESHFAYFLKSDALTLKFEQKSFFQEFVLVHLVIQGVDRSLVYRKMKGLEKLPSEKGSEIWSLFSSPSPLYQSLYQFYYDAFAILDLSRWEFRLHYRNILNVEEFHQEIYPVHIFDPKKEILVGCTLDLSKSCHFLGLKLREGISLAIDRTNRNNALKEKRLRCIFLDNAYTPYKAYQCVQELLQNYHTPLILSPLGTPTTAAFLPLAIKKEALILFPYTGATLFRKPELDYIFHLRTSYTNEVLTLVYHTIHKYQIKKFAVFYQDDAYGQAGKEGARLAFAKYKINEFLEIPYLRNNLDVEKAAATIRDFDPEAIVFISTPTASSALVNNLTPLWLSNKILLGVSFVSELFRDFLTSKGLEFTMSQVMPNPLQEDYEIVNRYREDTRRYYHTEIFSTLSLEGYINTSFFIEILQHVENPTPEKIVAYIKNIKNYSFGGLTLNFDPMTHELFKKVWIDTGKEWVEYDLNIISYNDNPK